MINKIGYACINESLKPKTFRSCRLKTVQNKGIEFLKNLILYNIDFTYEILEWNIKNHIYMYRITSGIMPLITHRDILSMSSWRWYNDFEILEHLSKIKDLVCKHKLRISMHPDQFTVLNSNRKEVVQSSIEYLNYHCTLLNYINGQDIILHVGGVYGDKKNAIKRFINTYNSLSIELKQLLRLENDDKSYSIFEVLEISKETRIPIVFDYHHYRCLTQEDISVELIEKTEKTWKDKIPKMHISSGKTHLKDRKHHEYISLEDCKLIRETYANREIDIMIEAKMKEKAALKFIKDLSLINNISKL